MGKIVYSSHLKIAILSYDCHQCRVTLNDDKNLIHVDDKNNISCLDCVRKHSPAIPTFVNVHGTTRPKHKAPRPVFVSHQDTRRINALRRKQNILDPTSWEKVDKFIDPALRGVAAFCKHYEVDAPEIGFIIGKNIVLDMAWPKDRIAIVIDPDDARIAIAEGWNCLPIFETFETADSFSVFHISNALDQT